MWKQLKKFAQQDYEDYHTSGAEQYDVMLEDKYEKGEMEAENILEIISTKMLKAGSRELENFLVEEYGIDKTKDVDMSFLNGLMHGIDKLKEQGIL